MHYTKPAPALGENVEVTHNAAGEVLVQGTVDTPQRKQEILTALQPLRAIEVRIATLAESRTGTPPAALSRSAGPTSQDHVAESGPSAIQRALQGLASPERITELANHAVSLSEDWVAEAWALRKLADAFPPDKLARLTAAGRKELAKMVRDHATSLRTKVFECQSELRAYLPAPPPGSGPAEEGLEWPGAARQIFFRRH